MSVVIEDDIPEDFEPSEEEVNEYAKWLGMDLPTDQHLLWIAREGIKAPLPDDWKPCKSSSGDIYYFNFRTGDSRWEHPQDDFYKELYRSEREKALRKSKSATASPTSADASNTFSLKKNAAAPTLRSAATPPGRAETVRGEHEPFQNNNSNRPHHHDAPSVVHAAAAVHVTLYSARHLPHDAGFMSSCDAFIELVYKDKTQKSTVKKNSLNPVWKPEETFEFDVSSGELADIQIQLKDWNMVTSSKLLGTAVIGADALKRLMAGDTFSDTFLSDEFLLTAPDGKALTGKDKQQAHLVLKVASVPAGNARSEPTEDVAIKANKPKMLRSAAPPPATSATTSPAAALPSSSILQEEGALQVEEARVEKSLEERRRRLRKREELELAALEASAAKALQQQVDLKLKALQALEQDKLRQLEVEAAAARKKAEGVGGNAAAASSSSATSAASTGALERIVEELQQQLRVAQERAASDAALMGTASAKIEELQRNFSSSVLALEETQRQLVRARAQAKGGSKYSGIGSFLAVSLLVAGGAAAAAVVLAPKFKDVKLAGLWR